MNIQLICMDLDGTALQHDRHSFSPLLNRTLEECHERGIAVVPVTGRQFGLLPPPLKCHPCWESLAVLCNGGQIRKLATGEVLFHLGIDGNACLQLLALAEKYRLPIEFSVDSILHLTPASLEQQMGDPGLTFHRDVILKSSGRLVDSLEPICRKNVEKINLLCIPPEIRDGLLRDMAEIPVSAVWASKNAMEITHRDASKGNALLRLCRMLDIAPQNVLALGDSGNDITMLQTAGLGVAMGSAPDFVKAAADLVTEDFDRDGAALAIRRYALNDTTV